MNSPSALWLENLSITAFPVSAISHSASSFLFKRLAEICFPVSMSSLYLIFMTVAGSFWVPILMRKLLPSVSSWSSIQRIDAVNILETERCVPFTNTDPRETSTSRSRVTVTGCPMRASSASRSVTRMEETFASSRLGSTVSVSPTDTWPLVISPANPLNDLFGLHTL